jgi:RNA polymerase sigma factor (sigma-70 family)
MGARKDHIGFTKTIEYRVATQVAWKYRRWLCRGGISPKEYMFDLLPHLVYASQMWRPDHGMAKWSFLWMRGLQSVISTMDKLDRNKRRRDNWEFLRHEMVYRERHELETTEVAQLAMAGVRSQRDREVLTMWCGGVQQKEIGQRLGLSGERVRQLLRRAIADARHALRKEAVRVGSCLDECWR